MVDHEQSTFLLDSGCCSLHGWTWTTWTCLFDLGFFSLQGYTWTASTYILNLGCFSLHGWTWTAFSYLLDLDLCSLLRWTALTYLLYLGCCSLHGWTASTHWEKDEGSSRGGRQNYCQAQRTGNCRNWRYIFLEGMGGERELKVYRKA